MITWLPLPRRRSPMRRALIEAIAMVGFITAMTVLAICIGG